MTAVVTETTLAMQKEEEENIWKSYDRDELSRKPHRALFTAAITEVIPPHLQIWLFFEEVKFQSADWPPSASCLRHFKQMVLMEHYPAES